MKAAQIDRYGKMEDVVVRDVPRPHPAEGQVLVKVAAAAVNPLDLLNLTGAVKLLQDYPMPLTLGNELAGTIEELGSGVSDLKPGDHVYARLPLDHIGAFAEYVAVDADALAPVPAGLDMDVAATVPLTGLTAWQALTEELEAKPGQRLLVTGGSGSLGQMVVPIAKELGLTVIVTGNEAARDRTLALGADTYLDYRTQDFATVLANDPVDAIVDTLGDEAIPSELSVLKRGGRLLSLRGTPNGEFAKRAGLPLVKRGLFRLAGSKIDKLARSQGKEYRFMFVRSSGEQLRRVSEIVERRALRPAVDEHEFGLDDIREALALVATGHPTGKVIVHP